MKEAIKPFITFCKDTIKEELDNYEGSAYYACDLGYTLTEGMNSDGTFTYSRELAKDYLKEWWDEADEYWDYEQENFGEHIRSPFGDPEAYIVCMVIEGVNGLLAKCPTIDKNWNEEIELTEDVICRIKDELDEISDDEQVF